MPDMVEAVKKGKFLFADVTDEQTRKVQTLHELNTRLIHELRAFSEYLEQQLKFFGTMSGIEDRGILNPDLTKEFRLRIYKVDSDMSEMIKRVHSNSKLAAVLDHIKRSTEALKSQGTATKGADVIIDKQLRPGLKDAIKCVDEAVKELEKVTKEEDIILRRELVFRRLF
ncbi:hypothetical protein KY363_03355 [Candidatus Woesearchaeota archaeon]|nr:hypothetical protein [Candidatus Woesearchaeota archaeon]